MENIYILSRSKTVKISMKLYELRKKKKDKPSFKTWFWPSESLSQKNYFHVDVYLVMLVLK